VPSDGGGSLHFGVAGGGPRRNCSPETAAADGVRPDLLRIEVMPPLVAAAARRRTWRGSLPGGTDRLPDLPWSGATRRSAATCGGDWLRVGPPRYRIEFTLHPFYRWMLPARLTAFGWTTWTSRVVSPPTGRTGGAVCARANRSHDLPAALRLSAGGPAGDALRELLDSPGRRVRAALV